MSVQNTLYSESRSITLEGNLPTIPVFTPFIGIQTNMCNICRPNLNTYKLFNSPYWLVSSWRINKKVLGSIIDIVNPTYNVSKMNEIAWIK